ncbi:MAG: exo-beta-N-acetylmuramidase NamZ domain-containing protein [Terriglobia bacterium]
MLDKHSIARASAVAVAVFSAAALAVALGRPRPASSHGGSAREPDAGAAAAPKRKRLAAVRSTLTRAAAAQLAGVAPLILKAIQENDCWGAVVVIGHNGRVVYRHAFGERTRLPHDSPMQLTTMFDLASLTKVIATTPAIMQLFQEGKIRLDDPVADYWPEFGENGKQEITVRELLTHYSGLPPDLPLDQPWSGYDTAMKLIVAAHPLNPPGVRFVYSDVNFETLGELVRRISGEPLNVYCERHIFRPLHMMHTEFKPPLRLRSRMAPTQPPDQKNEMIPWYAVNDPTSYRMGGIAGHAGLYSTAGDLAIYAQMLLNGGIYHGVRVLSPMTVMKMTTPASPPRSIAVHGLGWDIDTAFSSNRGELFPVGSFGHTGWTGTSIWIDPFSKTYVIILTDAVHPGAHGNVIPLRAKIATLAAAAFGRMPTHEELETRASETGYYELLYGYRAPRLRNGQVDTGIDVLEAEYFKRLQGMHVGLITNPTGSDLNGRRTIDVLDHAPGVKLVAIFSPEHGLYGTAEGSVASGREPSTGLPIYSLYGATRHPTAQMMAGIDSLVFDIQGVGVRYYTYITTLEYAMEAAAQYHIPIFVLDRPDPISGAVVEGPVLDANLVSFVGCFPMPVRMGMTLGELAQMINQQNHIGADLRVVKMRGWRRTDWFDETGLRWINPSPNLRNLTEEILYPGLGMLEYGNISVGRGTDTPFEVLGAPWIDGVKLAAYLNARRIPGVRFIPVDFMPSASKFKGELCHGINVQVLDRRALDSPELGIEVASALVHLFPQNFQLDPSVKLIGSSAVLNAIKSGQDPRAIELHWESQFDPFLEIRRKYLLY